MQQRKSAECGFHIGILRARQDVTVILHFQSPFATAITCSDKDYKYFNVIPEIPYYIGAVAVIPYLNPGSNELAHEVVSVMKCHDLAILKNHGQVTVRKNFEAVIQKVSFFELACEIILCAGEHIQFLFRGCDCLSTTSDNQMLW